MPLTLVNNVKHFAEKLKQDGGSLIVMVMPSHKSEKEFIKIYINELYLILKKIKIYKSSDFFFFKIIVCRTYDFLFCKKIFIYEIVYEKYDS